MERKDLIAMASEAGFGKLLTGDGLPTMWHGTDLEMLDRFAKLVYSAELSSAKAENVKLREQIGKDMGPAAIGKAIYRACGELPEGYDLHIECERGAATVRLHLPESDADISDFGSDTTLDGEIHNAINVAITTEEAARCLS